MKAAQNIFRDISQFVESGHRTCWIRFLSTSSWSVRSLMSATKKERRQVSVFVHNVLSKVQAQAKERAGTRAQARAREVQTRHEQEYDAQTRARRHCHAVQTREQARASSYAYI